MEKYKEIKGRYPKNIFDLTPIYIERIPLIPFSDRGIDEIKFNVLRLEGIERGSAHIVDDGTAFVITFYPKDDRICLSGKNNICEYTSEAKQWKCYQH